MFQIINAMICDFDLFLNNWNFFGKAVVLSDFAGKFFNFDVSNRLRFAICNKHSSQSNDARYDGGDKGIHVVTPLIHIQTKLCMVVVGDGHIHII